MDIQQILKFMGTERTPEKLEKTLAFFEAKGNLNAYRLLFNYFFTHYPEMVSRKRFMHTYEKKYTYMSQFDIENLMKMFAGDQYAGIAELMKLKDFFHKRKDKLMYKKIITHMVERYGAQGLDSDVLKGYININTCKASVRNRLFAASKKPKALLALVKNKWSFIEDFITSRHKSFDFSKFIKVVAPEINQWLLESLQGNDYHTIIRICRDVLYNPLFMREYIKPYFCKTIGQIIEHVEAGNTTRGLEFPLTKPLFRSCHKKYKHFDGYNHVTRPDEWGQHIVLKGRYYGVMDDKGKLVVDTKYSSIGPIEGERRKALYGHYSLVYLTRDGQEITAR